MQLTTHFSLEEMTHSQVADRLSLPNEPSPDQLIALRNTALGLESIRLVVGAPILVSSGFRSAAVNKAVGSTNPKSQHTLGEAADITCSSIGSKELMRRIYKSNIMFDQCILEYASKGGGWVHVSFRRNPRRQALVIEASGTTAYG